MPPDLGRRVETAKKHASRASPIHSVLNPDDVHDLAGVRIDDQNDIAEIAERESQGERHIRLLAPSPSCHRASLQPLPAAQRLRKLTVTGLAKALPYSW